jgi:hypothetical protein
LETWRRAVQLERERLLIADTGIDHHIDSYFCVIALSQLLRAAKAMEIATKDALLRKALEQFQVNVPDAKDPRDILSHFDAYQAGTGKLQKKGRMGELVIYLEAGENRRWLRINHLKIEFASAASNADMLAGEAFDASARFMSSNR